MFLRNVAKLFASAPQKAKPRRSNVSLRVEGLEARDVPAFLGGVANLAHTFGQAAQQVAATVQSTAAAVQSTSLGGRMADYLQGQVAAGRRIGGGECAHLAIEALRVAGADFTRTEPAGTSDYVWSSNRVARLTHGSQLAGKRFQVGDIIQYQNATFSSGGSGKLAHHTQVVAAVDSGGRITRVFEQNVNGNRTAQRRAILDLTKLSGGSVSIYRPVARVNQAGLKEFTIVNNTNSSKTYTLQIGSSSYNNTLSSANTANSFTTRWAQVSGSTAVKLKIGGATVTVEHGAAYELYTTSNGTTGIRRI